MANNGKQPKQDPASKTGPGQESEDVRRGDSNRDTDIDVDFDPEDMEPNDRSPSGDEAGDED